MKELPNSERGEGVGGPVETVADPNAPSFDPAAHSTATDEKIRTLFSGQYAPQLTPWEVGFLSEVYGASKLTRKQHIRVWAIYKRVVESA
jgi:hypothetical protein